MTIECVTSQPSNQAITRGGSAFAGGIQSSHLMVAALSAAAFLLAMPATRAADTRYDPSRLVPITYGLNEIDLDGDGLPDLVLKSWRPPMASGRSASSSAQTIFTFLIYRSGDPDVDHSRATWDHVAFDKNAPNDRKGAPSFAASQVGACVIRDLRLITASQRHPMILIEASRDALASSGRDAHVLFREFKLVVDREPMDGAQHYFQFQREWRTDRKYCDVNVAFRLELGLPCVGTGERDTPGCAVDKPSPRKR